MLLYCDQLFHVEDFLLDPDFKPEHGIDSMPSEFHQTTDENGLATLYLPEEEKEISVGAKGYESQNSVQLYLKVGEVTKLRLKMIATEKE